MSELLDAVLADPADDDLRRVYADRLCELGDPRGELIQLQFARLAGTLSAEGLARERELLDRHAVDWLGPLATVVDDGYRFERGFLFAAIVPRLRHGDLVERVAGHPLWATVEELAGPPAIYLHPVMRSLRVLSTFDPIGTRTLLTGDVRRPIRRLVCGFFDDMIDHVGVASALPQLAELALPLDDPRGFAFNEGRLASDTLRELLATPVTARLSCLELTRGFRSPDLHDVLAELHHQPTVARVVFRDVFEFAWQLARGDDGCYRRVRVALPPFITADRIAEQLAMLDGASHVEVIAPDDAALAGLERAGRRFAGFAVVGR